MSPLPLREEVPPREAKVAADKLETVRAPYNHTQLKMVTVFFQMHCGFVFGFGGGHVCLFLVIF